ncbi:unnamed protein product, partial [Heligmosomoides polygyrus]|uniref:Fibronectin type-III domain-containing protein n=1 Tax=Heligmosomoides polygyrus TaxID=6339 RepID=A0A183F9K9_HELPZ
RYRFCAIVSRHVPDWAVCGELNEGLESIHCVPQTNNSMVIRKLRSGKHYFITLFVRDSVHGSTSSYETLEVFPRRSSENTTQEVKKDEVAILSAYFYDSMTPSSHTRIPRIFLVIPKSVVSNAPGGSPGRHVHHGLSFLVHFRSRASKTRGLNNWYRSHLKRIKHYLNIPSASTSNYKEYLIMSPKCQLCIHV